MDWKTFIAEIIKSLIWPSLICIVLILFKKQFSLILNEFAKFPYLRWKRGENELEIGARQLREDVKDISLEESQEKAIKTVSKAIDNPKETIEIAWNDFEQTAKETAGIEYNQSFELEHALKQSFKLPEDKFKLFMKLKEIKNQAVHDSTTVVTSGTAVDYSESAFKLSKYLKDHKK